MFGVLSIYFNLPLFLFSLLVVLFQVVWNFSLTLMLEFLVLDLINRLRLHVENSLIDVCMYVILLFPLFQSVQLTGFWHIGFPGLGSL